LVAAATLVLGACMTDLVAPDASPTAGPTTVPPTTSSSSTTTTAAPTTTTTLGYEWPDDIEGSVMNWHVLISAFELRHAGTVENLADSATLVIVAIPVGPGPALTLGGDPDNNEVIRTPSRVIEVVDVLRSRVELYGLGSVTVGDRITVALDHSPVDPDLTHPAILFLTDPRDPRYLWEPDPEHIAPEHREYVMSNWEAWNEFLAGKFQFFNGQSILVGNARQTVLVTRWPNTVDPLDTQIDGVPIAEIVELIRSMPPPAL
jgi:hypothetical protein